MPRAKKAAAAPRSAPLSKVAQRVVLHLFIAALFASGIVALFIQCKQYVDVHLATPTRPLKVVLENRPAWMSDGLADDIARTAAPASTHSSFDHQLLVETADLLQQNPWVEEVNSVRRVYGQRPGDTLEIDCRYRAPAALVKWGQYYWLVDDKGFVLPEQYTVADLPRIAFAPDGSVNLRIIQGVAHAPARSGQHWLGEDLAGGLELARLLASRPCTQQIRAIDVSNFAGRKNIEDPQIVLITQYGTQIRWGRPPGAGDAFIEVSPTQKLAAIQNVWERTHRVDANQPWIDVRFDRVTCPSPSDAAESRSADAGDR